VVGLAIHFGKTKRWLMRSSLSASVIRKTMSKSSAKESDDVAAMVKAELSPLNKSGSNKAVSIKVVHVEKSAGKGSLSPFAGARKTLARVATLGGGGNDSAAVAPAEASFAGVSIKMDDFTGKVSTSGEQRSEGAKNRSGRATLFSYIALGLFGPGMPARFPPCARLLTPPPKARVIAIDWRDAALVGSIPAVIGKLVRLKSLNLSFNEHLVGAVPGSMWTKQIEEVDLTFTSISKVTEDIKRCGKLKQLMLEETKIHGKPIRSLKRLVPRGADDKACLTTMSLPESWLAVAGEHGLPAHVTTCCAHTRLGMG
jgi:hypothetical protein